MNLPMQSARSATASRASRAFSSFAVSVALAVLTILALAFGNLQDIKAEFGPGGVPGGSASQPPSLHQDLR